MYNHMHTRLLCSNWYPSVPPPLYNNTLYDNMLYDNRARNYGSHRRYNGGYDERYPMRPDDTNQSADIITKSAKIANILHKIQQGFVNNDPDITDLFDRIQYTDISPFRMGIDADIFLI